MGGGSRPIPGFLVLILEWIGRAMFYFLALILLIIEAILSFEASKLIFYVHIFPSRGIVVPLPWLIGLAAVIFVVVVAIEVRVLRWMDRHSSG